MDRESFGCFVRRLREERRVGLRQFCASLNIDPSRWSKIERGVLQPPHEDKILKAIAKLLSIKLNTDEWIQLKDLAVLGRGELPKDILEDEELVGCLPLVFRTLRNEKPTRDQLVQLVDLMRHSNSGE